MRQLATSGRRSIPGMRDKWGRLLEDAGNLIVLGGQRNFIIGGDYNPDDVGRKHLLNVSKLKPDYTSQLMCLEGSLFCNLGPCFTRDFVSFIFNAEVEIFNLSL